MQTVREQRANTETETHPSDLPLFTYLAQGDGSRGSSPEPSSSCGGHYLPGRTRTTNHKKKQLLQIHLGDLEQDNAPLNTEEEHR